MTIDITDEQRDYLREHITEKVEENLDLDEYEMLIDLLEKLEDETQGVVILDFGNISDEDTDPNQLDLFSDTSGEFGN